MQHSSKQKRVLARRIAKELTPEEVKSVVGGATCSSKYCTYDPQFGPDFKDGTADDIG